MITTKDIAFKDIPLPPIEARDYGATEGRILLTYQIRWSKNQDIRIQTEDMAKRDIEVALMCRVYGEIRQLVSHIRREVALLDDAAKFYRGIDPADTNQLKSDLNRILAICRGEVEPAEMPVPPKE